VSSSDEFNDPFSEDAGGGLLEMEGGRNIQGAKERGGTRRNAEERGGTRRNVEGEGGRGEGGGGRNIEMEENEEAAFSMAGTVLPLLRSGHAKS
jgi:hypothetical protein